MRKIVSRKPTIRSHKLYKVWRAMNDRCYNENLKNYKDYGGRGVTVSDRWRDNYEAFYKWAIGNFPPPFSGWKPGLQLDKDVRSGGHFGNFYCPECCCFVTNKENMRRKGNNLVLTYNGVSRCATEWSELLGVEASVVGDRIRMGWSVERAVTQALNLNKWQMPK
jgi:hypothetical protein